MIPWIQVYSNLLKHPKTYDLADELKLSSKDASPNAVAAGMLVSLWLWAAQNATDGDLSKCSARAIADAAEYKKSPAAFVAALEKTKWLDAGGKLHDWDEYATLLNDLNERQREQTKKRVERHRAKKKRDGNGDVTHECSVTGNVTKKDCNATDTPCNAPTIPNHTLPNHNNSTSNTVIPSAGTAEGAPAIMEGRSFTLFWEDYPNKSDRADAWEAWKRLNPDAETVAAIKAGLSAWKQSGQWRDDGGRYIPSAAKWLEKRRWEWAPVPGKGDIPKGASGELGEAELEAIQRVLAQPVEETGEDV